MYIGVALSIVGALVESSLKGSSFLCRLKSSLSGCSLENSALLTLTLRWWSAFATFLLVVIKFLSNNTRFIFRHV